MVVGASPQAHPPTDWSPSPSPTSRLLRPAPFPSLASSSRGSAPCPYASVHKLPLVSPPHNPALPLRSRPRPAQCRRWTSDGPQIISTLTCPWLRGLMLSAPGPFDPRLPIGSTSTQVSIAGSLKADTSRASCSSRVRWAVLAGPGWHGRVAFREATEVPGHLPTLASRPPLNYSMIHLAPSH